jgi:membrane protein, antimicrobial resistance system
MNVYNRLVSIVVSPSRVFDDIRDEHAGWVPPWIAVSLIGMLISYLSMPVQRAVLELNAAGLPADKLDQQMAIMGKMLVFSLILTPAVVLLVTGVVAGISYIMLATVSQRANFKQYFTLAMFTGVISVIGPLLSTVVIRLRGVDRIIDMEDAKFSLSLRPLAPPDSVVLKGLFGSFEFFTIWSSVLLVMGMMRIFGLSRGKAIAVLVPVWILYVGLLILGEKFGGVGG